MKAKDYVPELYENNIHMKAIVDDYDAEIDENLKQHIEDEFHNNSVLTSNEQGVEKYEYMLKIKPTSNEDLLTRKKVIINRLTSHLPYTKRFLEQKLDEIVGVDNWQLTMDYANYEMTIQMTRPGNLWYNELIKLLTDIVPCNIDWHIQLYSVSWQEVKDSFATWNDLTSYTWQQILNGDFIN